MLKVAGWMIVCLALGGPVAGCGGPPRVRTTFLRSVDLVDMTDRMAKSFAADEVISARRFDDEPWIISIGRVVNHTSQIISDDEKWLYVGRLRARLAESDVAARRRLIWIVPPERWPAIAKATGATAEPYGLRMDPTHLLTAQFDALTTTSGRGRSDAYHCSYQLVELASGEIEWEDAWEAKRAVEGVTYD